MTSFDTELATTISREEHRPKYAEKNAYAFLNMAQGVAETYGLDQDELRIENHQHGDDYFVVEENGDLETYVVSNPDSDIDYDSSKEERNWQRSMTIGQFEESLENITNDKGFELHGLSRGMNYQMKSSTPPGMMEGFGGPRKVPTEYGDAIMYISDKDKNVRYCFKGAPNSGASIQPSLTERGLVKVKSMLSDQSEEDILIDRHQSNEEPNATLTPIPDDRFGPGMEKVETETIEEIAENINEFDIEIR
jgi:hypothetical protein